MHMKNQINVDDQNAQQAGRNINDQSLNTPANSKINYWMILTLILTILFFGISGLYVFSIYKNSQSGSNVLPIKPPLSSELACSKDDDCIIGIQTTSCCSCPKAVNQKLIGTKDWEQYESGKDYSSRKSEFCRETITCKPCEFPETPTCSSGKCQFPNQMNIQPSDAQNQNASVSIQFKKTTYGLDEPIVFTITNNTQQNAYYFPETCATSLVQVFIIPDNNSTPIQGDQKICMLAPTVETLLPNGNITSKIPDKTLSKMVPGRYKIKFYYSLEKRDLFALGEKSIVESETLTISE